MYFSSTSAGADAHRLCIWLALFREVFKELRTLGQGNFSKVFHVKNRVDGLEYAVKRSKQEVCDESLKRQWFQVRMPPPGVFAVPQQIPFVKTRGQRSHLGTWETVLFKLIAAQNRLVVVSATGSACMTALSLSRRTICYHHAPIAVQAYSA